MADQSDLNAKRMPVVSEKNGEVFASSRDVASFFERNHRDVTRAIDLLVEQEPNLALRNFTQGVYLLPETGAQQHRMFDMTRDGFVLLAMGFTGAKALKFKLAYIEAFNAMEAELRNRVAPDPMAVLNDPAAMRGLLLTYTEKVIALQAENAELAPKAEGFDQIANADGLYSLNSAAKILGQQPMKFNQMGYSKEWWFRKNGRWCAYADKVKAGYLFVKVSRFTKPDGSEAVSETVYITPLGLTKLSTALRLN